MSGKRLNKVFDNIGNCPVEYTGQLPNRFINIKGEKYNHLTVLYLTGFKRRRAEWLCQCDCGKYVIVDSHNLRTEHTKSCGHLVSEMLRNDLVGKQFGYLKVLKYIRSKNESPVYQVKCLNCGRIYEAAGASIQKQYSCGCISSKAANIIFNTIRKNLSTSFISQIQTEKTFEDCVFKEKLKFDFYLIYKDTKYRSSEGMLMEYDGVQHYNPTKFSKNTTESESYKHFISNQVRDWIKDHYCLQHNIPLIRIKYTNKKNPTFKDIYKNSYIVGRSQGNDDRIDIYGLIDNDFVNNKITTFNIMAGVSCTFKCCKNDHSICQNCELTNNPIINCSIDDLIDRYLNQNIAHCITLQGLECLDNLKQVTWFIYKFRKVSNDPIFIWTGYTEEECEDFIYLIKNILCLENIYIKFGRYIPNHKPHRDEILGIDLASDNQYAKKIS